ncbi:MAG: UDP-N-acetylmuramoyl-L-alanine--D-glutamate ligase [Steroidobacteraceae bacterium]
MNATTSTTRKAVIVGLGKTGVSAARHLLARGWRVAVTDSRSAPPGREALAAFAPQVECRFGGFDSALLDGADIVVASPGVAPSESVLREASARGLDIVGDVELFAREVRAPVIGITGTNGKSTVTTLVGRMAARAGVKVAVGGNLGTPALDLLEGEAPTLFVLEISSFQLDTTRSLQLRAGTVLNVTPDHLDRYGDIERYAKAKAHIFECCEIAVVNLDDPRVPHMPLAGQRVLGFSIDPARKADYGLVQVKGECWLAIASQAVLAVSQLRLTGLHNVANALAALALGDAAGLPREAMLAELREFTGLPHRSQWVAERRGVRYVNDSKGTNVGAAIAAVEGASGPLIMIAGGDGKDQDFSPLGPAFASRVRLAVLIGRDAPQLARALAGHCPTLFCSSLEEAVRMAADAARPGDTVLLSPACASLDMFRDYAHRGEVFAAAVEGLPA